jgi:hypothetical protein
MLVEDDDDDDARRNWDRSKRPVRLTRKVNISGMLRLHGMKAWEATDPGDFGLFLPVVEYAGGRCL